MITGLLVVGNMACLKIFSVLVTWGLFHVLLKELEATSTLLLCWMILPKRMSSSEQFEALEILNFGFSNFYTGRILRITPFWSGQTHIVSLCFAKGTMLRH